MVEIKKEKKGVLEFLRNKDDPLDELITTKKQLYAMKLYDSELKKLDKEWNDLANTNNVNSIVNSMPNIPLIETYMKWINSLPEGERPLALQLLTSLSQPKIVQSAGNDLTPLLLLLYMMRKEEGQQNDGGTLQLLLKNIEMQMKQMELQSQERLEQMKQLYNLIREGGKGENLSDLISALGNLKTSPADEMLQSILTGLLDALSKQGDPIDQLMKYQKAGLLLDPKTLLDLKKEERRYELERYKIDKNAEIELKKREYDREQMEKASEFLEQMSSVAEELLKRREGGEGERGEEKGEKSQGNVGNVSNMRQTTIPILCPNCGKTVTVPADAADGYELQCEHCHKKLRVRRKKE